MGANRLLIPANRANFALRPMKPCVLRERPHRTRLRFRAFNPRGEPGALPGWSNSACRRSVLECGPKLMANPKHLKAIRRGSKGRGSPTRTSEKRSSSRRISAKRPNDAANLYDGDLCTKNISGANLRGTTLVEARCTWQDRSARTSHSVLPAPLTQAGSRPDQTGRDRLAELCDRRPPTPLASPIDLRRSARRRRFSHALATHLRTPQSIPIIFNSDRMSAISVP